ncbi:MAG: hypothetical protein ACM3SR_09340 [Ignavibacteriales bacterium]
MDIVISLPRDLFKRFNSWVQKQATVNANTAILELIKLYAQGKLEPGGIEGTDRPKEVEFHAFIPDNMSSLWEDFQKMCDAESKDPRKVIVDLIDLSTREKSS